MVFLSMIRAPSTGVDEKRSPVATVSTNEAERAMNGMVNQDRRIATHSRFGRGDRRMATSRQAISPSAASAAARQIIGKVEIEDRGRQSGPRRRQPDVDLDEVEIRLG